MHYLNYSQNAQIIFLVDSGEDFYKSFLVETFFHLFVVVVYYIFLQE